MNASNSVDKINNMYRDLSYFDQYGGSVFIFIILTIILIIVYTYGKIMKDIQPIKQDWSNKRCDPLIIPFAGMINKPDKMSAIEFTGNNFNYCIQNISTSLTGELVKPITYILSSITYIFKDLDETFQYMRKMITNIRTAVMNVSSEVMNRLLNIMTPIMHLIVVFKDSMAKVNGILVSGLYTSLSTYYALKSFLGAITQVIVVILGILATTIISMWLIPFTWPAAAGMTAIFLSISIPLTIIVIYLSRILNINPVRIPGVPKKPRFACFDKNTKIFMENNTYKLISEIKQGEKLHGNVFVTAILKLDATTEIMYNLKDIIVSGSHRVKYNNKWILVSDHPNSIKLHSYHEPYIYCLNTDTKEIIINDIVFSDWDEVYTDELKKLSQILKLDHNFKKSYVHKYFDSGFFGNTKMILENNKTREIKDLKVGDILQNGIKIYGIVEIDGTQILNQYKYNLGLMKEFSGFVKTLDEKYSKIPVKKNNKLYHLLSDKGFFYIENILFYDYNSAVELYLDT